MKRIIRVTLIITLGMLMLTSCASKDIKANSETDMTSLDNVTTVIVGTMGTYSPFSYYDSDDNLTGYDIEVLRKIEEVDPTLHFEFQSGAWESLFPALDSGKYDMIANQISSNESRREKYYLTENSYFVSKCQLIVHSENESIHSFEDMVSSDASIGLTVGDYNNYTAELWNQEHSAEQQLNIQYYNEDISTILQDIDNGRIAATINDPAVAISKAETQGLSVKPVGDPLAQTPVYFIFSKDEEGRALRDRIDAALQTLKQSGELVVLSKEWFNADYTEIR